MNAPRTRRAPRQRPTKRSRHPWNGEGQKPIYRHEMAGVSWQLLWWLTIRMDENGEVAGGWRTAAGNDIGKHRAWISRCADQLQAAGLIDAGKGVQRVRVRTENFIG